MSTLAPNRPTFEKKKTIYATLLSTGSKVKKKKSSWSNHGSALQNKNCSGHFKLFNEPQIAAKLAFPQVVSKSTNSSTTQR